MQLKPIAIALLLFSQLSFAQENLADSIVLHARAEQLLAYYQGFMGKGAHLYNGKAYSDHPPGMEGHAYLDSPGWQSGTVTYEGITYHPAFLKYDLVKGVVVVQHFDKIHSIQLVNAFIDSFQVAGHSFIRLQKRDDSAMPEEGFYDLLTRGPISLLARRTKAISDHSTTFDIVRKVTQKNDYYALKEGVYHRINQADALIQLAGERKKTIQQYVKKNKIRYRRNPELALIRITEYYNLIAN